MNEVLRSELMRLSLNERLEMMAALWESLEPSETLTPEQMAEIDRRMAEHEKDPDSAIPAEQVMARLHSLLK